VSFCGASAASHTIVSAPSPTERVALAHPYRCEPSRATRIHRELPQHSGELGGHAVERSFRNAVSRRPTVRAAGQLPATGDIDHTRRFTFSEQGHERACHAQRAERVCLKGYPINRRGRRHSHLATDPSASAADSTVIPPHRAVFL